jgi:putative ABC transport system permease protein
VNWRTLVLRNLGRRPARSLLTALGIASALVLFVMVDSLAGGFDRALAGSEAARTLVVYRRNRYCPQTSHLPEHYGARIRALAGVESVLPVRVWLNDCRTNLDLVAFHGVPPEGLLALPRLRVPDEAAGRFASGKDQALAGRGLAARKGLKAGDTFRMGDVSVQIAGIVASAEPRDEGVLFTHLDFLQRSAAVRRPGFVTQFEVRVVDAAQAGDVARAVDALFAEADPPTGTRLLTEFLATATADLREVVRFARLLGALAAAVVLALVTNTVFLSVRERVREFGVLRTVGFGGRHLVGLITAETVVLTMAGAAAGVLGCVAGIAWWAPSIGSEGIAVKLELSPWLLVRGLGVGLLAALGAAAIPAWLAVRNRVVDCLRAP